MTRERPPGEPAPVRVLLARHGETVANVEGRWQGQTDSPLTERGLLQAGRLAESLADQPVAAVYSSDLGRALRSAEIVAAPHGIPVTVDVRLREIDTGAWSSRLGAEIRAEDPSGLETWLSRPWSFRMPGGETLGEMQGRAADFFQDRMPLHAGQTVVVITHGTAAQTILALALQRALTDLWLPEGRIENCQVSRLEWTSSRGLRLVELSDISHLAGVGSIKGWRVMDREPEN